MKKDDLTLFPEEEHVDMGLPEELESRLRALEAGLERMVTQFRGWEEKVQPVSAQLAQLRNEINACVQYMVTEIAPQREADGVGSLSEILENPSLAIRSQEFQEKVSELEAAVTSLQAEHMRVSGSLGSKVEEQSIRLTEMDTRLSRHFAELKEFHRGKQDELRKNTSAMELRLKGLEEHVKTLAAETSEKISLWQGEFTTRLAEIQAWQARVDLLRLEEAAQFKEWRAQTRSGGQEAVRVLSPEIQKLMRRIEKMESRFNETAMAAGKENKKNAFPMLQTAGIAIVLFTISVLGFAGVQKRFSKTAESSSFPSKSAPQVKAIQVISEPVVEPILPSTATQKQSNRKPAPAVKKKTQSKTLTR